MCDGGGMNLRDPRSCYRALQSRDQRFDGRLFVGVLSTGIYCRPICPARTPRFENCRFFPSAPAAQDAGFRPCLRCRPESAPELAGWRGTSGTVSRALALIADGALDDGVNGVESLGDRLGVGGRQLRRLFRQHLGASPVAVAQTRRVLLAKQLIEETGMPLSDVALAAGFGSVRRFNETLRHLFGRPPGALRAPHADESARARNAGIQPGTGVTLRVRYRPPYDWEAMLGHLAARLIEGVEEVEAGVYRRTAAIEGHCGTIAVAHDPLGKGLAVTVDFPHLRALPAILNRVRRVFDLGADVQTIGAHLSLDPFMASLVSARPGLRAPGGWEPFELAVRAVLGQQVTVPAARRLGGELVALCGEPVRLRQPDGGHLTHAFPTAARVASADLAQLRMPSTRRDTLRLLAEAVASEPCLFERAATLDEALARLRRLRGIGEWTAQYIALRAFREPDAFPAGDSALRRGAMAETGVRPTAARLTARAEVWRPWRAYAAQHLWACAADTRQLQERPRT